MQAETIMDAAVDRGGAVDKLSAAALKSAGASAAAVAAAAAGNTATNTSCTAGAMVVGESRRRVKCPDEFRPGTLIGR
jgi:hypothetical protein